MATATATKPARKSKFGAARVDCPICDQRVYPTEAVQLEGISYHKACMKCTHCQMTVSLKGLAVINGKLYCKPHFVELFKSGGGRYETFGKAGTAAGTPGIAAPHAPADPPKSNGAQEKPTKEADKESAIGKQTSAVSSTVSSKVLVPGVLKKKQDNSEIMSPKSPFGGFKLKSASKEIDSATAAGIPDIAAPHAPADPPKSNGAQEKPTKEADKESAVGKQTSAVSSTVSSKVLVPGFLPRKQDNAENKRSKSPFGGFKLKSSSKETDSASAIFGDVKKQDLDALKQTIQANGIDCIFEEGADGMTPIEYAFKNNSQECGRYMIQYLKNQIKK